MRILILLAHPQPGRFNHMLAGCAAETLRDLGHEPVLVDLYAEGFDAILPPDEARRSADLPDAVREASAQLATADGIVVIHPNWWGMPPAILVGWIDRVFRVDVAYRFLEGDSGEGTPVGLLKARSAIVFNTANTAPEREKDVFGDPLERIWRDCIFGLCGVTDFHRRTFTVMVTSTPEQRDAWLDEAAALVERVFPVDA